MASARFQRDSSVGRERAGCGRNFSMSSMAMPPTISMTETTSGENNTVLDGLVGEEPDHHRGEERRQDHRRRNAARRAWSCRCNAVASSLAR